jgi:DnaJ-class molecular chaperone
MGGEDNRQPCPFCGGSGQLSSFKGVSRFLLTVEECPECMGLGFSLPREDAPTVAAEEE